MNDTDEQARRNHASGVGGTGAMEDAPVGYRNPPRKHRFKKGQSGNPHGRRKGEPNMLGIFKMIAEEKVRVRVDREVRIMTRAEYVLRANQRATLKKKLDLEFRPYTILGACNPQFAHKALESEDKIGTMLLANWISRREIVRKQGRPLAMHRHDELAEAVS